MPYITYDELAQDPLLMLVYGPPGVGKTVLAASAVEVPEMRPVLFADFEKGYLSIRDLFRQYPQDIRLLRVTGVADIRELLKHLGPKGEYRTVVIDSLTEMNSLFMSAVLAGKGRANEAPQIQDYGEVMGKILDVLRSVKNAARLHFICICGEMTLEDPMTGTLYIEPDMTGKLAKRVPRYFDIVGHLSAAVRVRQNAAEVTRTLQVQPYNRIRAKDRTPGGALGPVVEAPTLKALYDIIYRGVAPVTPPAVDIMVPQEAGKEERIAEGGSTPATPSDDVALFEHFADTTGE